MKIFSWIKYFYMLALPWLGYVAVMVTDTGPSLLLVGTGWLLVVIYQMFILGSYSPKVQLPAKELLLGFIAPITLMAGQFIRKDGSLWNFFLEDSLTELVALNVALLFLFAREMKKALTTEKRSIGPAVPGVIILLGFTGSVFYSLIVAWLELHPGRNEFSVLNLSVAFIASVTGYFTRFKNGDMFSREDDKGFGIIIVQIFLWLGLLPIYSAIMHS